MSRIAPDIPELQGVPEALRSIAYTRALNRAIRSPLTWLPGAAVLALLVGVGATQGSARLGTMGAVLGAAAGLVLAFLCFFKVILPWRARRVLPSLTDPAELEAFDHLRRADESLQRIAATFEGKDAPPDGPKKPPPTRLRVPKPPRPPR